jgi:uroporphyrin-III C-methyltransferase
MRPGHVTLVGAGPGDPELLTLKAVRAIERASLLLVDDLVSDAVVALARPDARIVYVGKRGGCRSTPQAFILKLMVASAREGHQVVRLKGGDPFIFGRGGEELEHLRAAGIDATVVNGITSALAAANALGVALTHRDQAQGVILVTGHAKRAGRSTDWRALAATAHSARLTLVIYMGVSEVQELEAALLTGLPACTPVAVVQDATLPTQRFVTGTLDCLAQAVAQQKIASPAIILVGEVTRAAARAVSLPGQRPGRPTGRREQG